MNAFDKPINDEPPAGPVKPAGPGGLSLFAASFVLPFASLSFYRRVVQRGTGRAILFFVVFMGLVACLSTAGLARGLFTVTNDIRRAFAEGRVPEITISGGLASVNAAQPVVIFNENRILVVIDTTGTLTDIDPTRFTSGFLLTRSELVVLNRGQSQRLPLAQLNDLFQQDPLIINAETTARLWQNFSTWFSAAGLLALLVWDVGVRLLYLAALAVVVFGVLALFQRQSYGRVLTVGVYAFVPALISDYILGRFGVNFLFLQTLILLAFWAVGLYAALARNGWDLFGPDRPLRAWRAWLGLPMLVILALDVIFAWPNGNLINLIAAAVTGIAIVGAGMFSLPHREED